VAAPEYVPQNPAERLRSYKSPPRRPDSWVPDRPADLTGRQPTGPMLGNPGPDQGYALVLADGFSGKLRLDEGISETDAIAGCLGVALKRASLFGRAPVIHDWTVAFTVWGFLDDQPSGELRSMRRKLFEDAANPHHYEDVRRIADLVPEETLRKTPAQVTEEHRADWRRLLVS
jgi:hypothetical protein